MKLNKKEISDYVQNFLKEDKSNKDITSKYFIDKKQKARASFLTEENIVLAGNNIVLYIFKSSFPISPRDLGQFNPEKSDIFSLGLTFLRLILLLKEN